MTTLSPPTLSLGETIKRIIDSRLLSVYTGFPGRIKSWDAVKQVADIEIMSTCTVPTGGPEDPVLIEEFPILPSVPVMFSAGGGYFVSFPLQVDDPVFVTFNQRDINFYRATGNVGDPSLPQTHGLSGAVFFPVNFDQHSKTLPDVSATNLVIGKTDGTANLTITPSSFEVGGNTDAAALASKVDQMSIDIALAFSTFLPGTGGASFPDPYLHSGTVASQKIKTDG